MFILKWIGIIILASFAFCAINIVLYISYKFSFRKILWIRKIYSQLKSIDQNYLLSCHNNTVCIILNEKNFFLYHGIITWGEGNLLVKNVIKIAKAVYKKYLVVFIGLLLPLWFVLPIVGYYYSKNELDLKVCAATGLIFLLHQIFPFYIKFSYLLHLSRF